jgi:hypothetical protein
MDISRENAEIASINPLFPPILGDFLKPGGRPQTPGRKYPASLFQRSHPQQGKHIPHCSLYLDAADVNHIYAERHLRSLALPSQ